jgi:hypothetical protein
MRYYFRLEWLTSNIHLWYPFLQKLGVNMEKPATAAMARSPESTTASAATGSTSTASKPARSALSILHQSPDLRRDEPHLPAKPRAGEPHDAPSQSERQTG